MALCMEIFSPELTLLDLLNEFDSVLWEERAFEAGTFTITAPLTRTNRALLREEHLLRIEGDAAGIVERLDVESDGETITASGRLLSGLLDRRILWGRYDLSGTAAENMTRLVNECAIAPENAARIIPNLFADPPSSGGSALRQQRTGGSLLDALSDVGTASRTAFGVRFDAAAPRLVFWTRCGVDRSTAQTAREPVFYSTELDDVLSAAYTCDATQYRTTALVAGEGEGAARVYEAVNDALSGLERRELFIDARDLQSDGADAPLTPEQYRQALQNRGAEKLSEHPLARTFDATVRTLDPTYVYGRDFFLGDIVTVTDERLAASADAVVTAVQRWAARDGAGMSITFGFGQPTVADLLRRAGT